MKIVIQTDEGDTPTPSVYPQPTAAAETAPAAPPDIAATAAALGAASAGPAPAEAAAEEPTLFVAEPVTPDTAPERPENMSAGAAPGFALGPVEEVAAENGAEAGGEAEG
jgi:hypothetical protein